jgi:glutamine amidotransferase
MCRLLGLYGQIRFWKELLFEFQKQSKTGAVPPIVSPGHKDGWGISVSNSKKDSMLHIERQLGSAIESLKYKKAISSLEEQPHITLGHLRKRSLHISVCFPNVQPFYTQNWAFIHNGSIYEAEKLPRDTSWLLTSENSDSEYYFHFLLAKLKEKSDSMQDIEIIRSALDQIPAKYSALNCLLSNGNELFVVRWHSKWPDYYTLYYYELKTGIIILSEPITSNNLDHTSWIEIPNFTVAKVSESPPKIEIITN